MGGANPLIKFLTQTLALSSDSTKEKDVNMPVDRPESPDHQDLSAPQTENPTASSSNRPIEQPIEQPEISEQRAHRKRRAVVLYECDCGLQVDASAIQCKHKGCETIWVSTHISQCRFDVKIYLVSSRLHQARRRGEEMGLHGLQGIERWEREKGGASMTSYFPK